MIREVAVISRGRSAAVNGGAATEAPTGPRRTAGPLAAALSVVPATSAGSGWPKASKDGAGSGRVIICSKPNPSPSSATSTDTAATLSALRCSHGVSWRRRRLTRRGRLDVRSRSWTSWRRRATGSGSLLDLNGDGNGMRRSWVSSLGWGRDRPPDDEDDEDD